jgi:hypothetical protein
MAQVDRMDGVNESTGSIPSMQSILSIPSIPSTLSTKTALVPPKINLTFALILLIGFLVR